MPFFSFNIFNFHQNKTVNETNLFQIVQNLNAENFTLLMITSKYSSKHYSARPVGNCNSNKHVELANPSPSINFSLILPSGKDQHPVS